MQWHKNIMFEGKKDFFHVSSVHLRNIKNSKGTKGAGCLFIMIFCWLIRSGLYYCYCENVCGFFGLLKWSGPGVYC